MIRTAKWALLGMALSLPLIASAQSESLWQDVGEASIARQGARQIVPQRYRAVALNLDGMIARLNTVPLEAAVSPQNSPHVISLPMPDGKMARFRVVESPIMEPGLAAKYPTIRTYLGQGVDDPTATLRFDTTESGFHAQVLSADGTVYIDPYQAGDTEHYISYARGDYTRQDKNRTCGVTSTDRGDKANTEAPPAPAVSSGASLRTFRLAMGATGEYTTFHGGTKIGALSGIVSTMNRVNGIYERDVAVRMVLVANTDLAIFTDGATDPYTNNDGGTLLDENQTTLDSLIGSANYDIGHVFSTGGGGIAALGSVCQSGVKAQGVTGSSQPTGDAYDVDYVAHEMGHQFDAEHTFNSTVGNCNGNRSAAHAFETGSGVSIMAYAGICGSEDLQPHSEDYFHRDSLTSILNFVSTACGTVTSSGNAVPTVTTAAAFTVPSRTPFELSATGSDTDAGDRLTYLWEQFNTGASTSGGGAIVDDGTRPLFRPLDPVLSGKRTFPQMRYVLNNANQPPATAPLPGTTTPAMYSGEQIANSNRTLNFRVTVRDNHAGTGGTNEASSAITVTTAAGPFLVTAPNTAVSWTAGSTQAITWDVANTTAAPVSAANVRLLLSLDNGESFPTVLAASVPNNGSANVTVPANTPATTQARVRVEAVGNVFFDVSDVPFTIVSSPANNPPTVTITGAVSTLQGSPATSANVGTVADTETAAGSLGVTVSGMPPEMSAAIVNTAGTLALTATAACELVAPTTTGQTKAYPLIVTVTDASGGLSTAAVNVNVGKDPAPTVGTYANTTIGRSASTTVTPSAAPADANNNLTQVVVSPTTLPGGGTVGVNLAGVVSITTTASTSLGTYPIRVSAIDACGATKITQFNLVVATPDPVINFSAAAVTSGNNLIEPNECNTINVTVGNGGGGAATTVLGALSTSTPGVTITTANSGYPDVPPGGTSTNTTAYQISTTAAVPCFSNIALSQSVTYAGAASPTVLNFTLPVGQAAAGNYSFASTTGQTLTPGTTLVTNSADDDAVVPITLPADFSFSLYGTTIAGGSTIQASTNGNVQFDTAGTNAYANAALPISATGGSGVTGTFPASRPTIFAYWDDLNLTGAGRGIFTAVTGSPPNRNFVIEWRGITFTGSNAVNFSLVLHEGSNTFDITYNNAAGASGSGATIGVQGAATGTTFTQFSLNTASISAGTKLTGSLPPGICVVGPGPCGGSSPENVFANGFE